MWLTLQGAFKKKLSTTPILGFLLLVICPLLESQATAACCCPPAFPSLSDRIWTRTLAHAEQVLSHRATMPHAQPDAQPNSVSLSLLSPPNCFPHQNLPSTSPSQRLNILALR